MPIARSAGTQTTLLKQTNQKNENFSKHLGIMDSRLNGQRIDLTPAELHICRMLGMMRRSEAMNKVKDQQMGEGDSWSIDIDGVVAEYCVAKLLNLCPDLTVSVRSGGADLITRKGKTLDVKSTRHEHGKLLATIKKAHDPCDMYVLVVVDNFGGTVMGWASKADLFHDDNKQDLGYGIGYAISQHGLRPFKQP